MSKEVPYRSPSKGTVGYPSVSELRNRITIQEPIEVNDGRGGQTTNWQDLATAPTVWAKIDPVSARELFFAEKLEDRISHRITIRHREDLRAEMRIQFKSRIFQIKTIRHILERLDFTIIEAVEGEAT